MFDIQYVERKPEEFRAVFYWHVSCNIIIKNGELTPCGRNFLSRFSRIWIEVEGRYDKLFLCFRLSFLQECPINCEKMILPKMRFINDKSNDYYPAIGERPISDTISMEIK